MRRVAALTSVAVALTASSVLMSAPTAGASGEGAEHFCGFFWVPNDDGMLNDPIHHNVEPLVPGLHDLNCQLQAQVDVVVCYLPALAFLSSSTFAENSPIFCPALT
jgi:hypothetical protein